MHHFHPTILREYDIRGIMGETLSDADARAIGRSFGSIVRRRGGTRVAVGYDGRLSSPALETALVQGLRDAGVDALRIGLGATPMLYYAVYALEADGGIQITGSHNPPNYNGFKMMLGQAPFFGEDIKALGAMAARGDWESGAGAQQSFDIIDQYVDRMVEGFQGSGFRIAWDAGNGAAGPALEKLVAKLPGEHVLLNTLVDGTFPAHHPDPTVEANLEQLKQAVAGGNLDFGIAFDGDGDRIGAIDGQGRVIWGDQLLAIYAEALLTEHPGAIVIGDVKSSQLLYDRIAALGGQPLMWKTGHSLIKAKMKETGSPLAGEMSGHVFFADRYYGFDDALYAGVRLIEAVSVLGGSLTALKDAMPALVSTPEMRFPCSEERKFSVIGEVMARLRQDGAQVNDIDGARVNTPDGWWLLRASNTQDVLVARAESASAEGLERLVAQINAQLAASGIEAVTVAH